MAILGTAHHSQDCCETSRTRLHASGPGSLVPKLLTVSVILSPLLFAGCARHPPPRELTSAEHESKAPLVRTPARTPVRAPRVAETIRYVQPTIRKPDPALLAPQAAPDCEFKRSDLKTVDPDEWARLKVEYERQCFRDAEKAARERLVLLQTSNLCEIEPVTHRKTAPLLSRAVR